MEPNKIASLAVESLLFEVAATPKPGLVDRENSGAHTDMDFSVFLRSAAALSPFFLTFAAFGFSSAGKDPVSVFSDARKIGLEAEKEMFRATNGVNTHKGLIFSMGLLCLSSGMLSGEGESATPSAVSARVAEMTSGLCEKDFLNSPMTNGEKIHAKTGVTGARGMAESGFSAVVNDFLPFLESRLDSGEDTNLALVRTLLFILSQIDDTNVIHRCGPLLAKEVRQAAKEAIFASEDAVRELDRRFVRQNVSPGGSADLLALTWFFHRLKKENI